MRFPDALSYVSSVGALLHTGRLFDPTAVYPFGFFLMIERGESPERAIALPAGRVEQNEFARTAIRREVKEELGLVLPEENYEPIVTSTVLKRRHWRVFAKRIIYTHEVAPPILFALASSWKTLYTPVRIPSVPFWDSEYMSGTLQTPNDEVRSLRLFHWTMLLHFASLQGKGFLPVAAPNDFFKQEILADVARWARGQYRS